jgi:hypothetical protein
MRRLAFFLVLTNLSAAAFAQVVPLRTNVRECDLTNCRSFTASGSAVHLGRTKTDAHVFLTAAHNLAPLSPNAILMDSTVISIQVNGEWLPASVIRSGRSQGIDLALLKVEVPLAHLRCLPVDRSPLETGDAVYMAGYPQGGDIRIISGHVVPTDFMNFPLAIDQTPIQGESGGAVVIEGKLTGIISGYPAMGKPVCLFTDAVTIQKFLETSLSHDPLCFPAR